MEFHPETSQFSAFPPSCTLLHPLNVQLRTAVASVASHPAGQLEDHLRHHCDDGQRSWLRASGKRNLRYCLVTFIALLFQVLAKDCCCQFALLPCYCTCEEVIVSLTTTLNSFVCCFQCLTGQHLPGLKGRESPKHGVQSRSRHQADRNDPRFGLGMLSEGHNLRALYIVKCIT